jgi:saccharopine dehydrogenase-like NADP-dependent oxidoreductase
MAPRCINKRTTRFYCETIVICGLFSWRWIQSVALTSLADVEAINHSLSDLEVLARRTKVLISTVGPYWKYGTPVVEACVKNGTHYLDVYEQHRPSSPAKIDFRVAQARFRGSAT